MFKVFLYGMFKGFKVVGVWCGVVAWEIIARLVSAVIAVLLVWLFVVILVVVVG